MNENSVAPHSCQHVVLSVFGVLAILVDVQWYFTIVFNL